MKRIALLIIGLVLLAMQGWAADTKESALTVNTSVLPTDIVRVVTTPQGTPASRNIQASRLALVTISTSTDVTVLYEGHYFAHEASNGAMNYNLPVVAASPSASQVPPGWSACFGNYEGHTSAITLTPPASHALTYKGVVGGATKTLVSAGAVGELVCIVAVDANKFQVLGAGYGTWTLTP